MPGIFAFSQAPSGAFIFYTYTMPMDKNARKRAKKGVDFPPFCPYVQQSTGPKERQIHVGLAKKVFIFIIVACGHLADGALGTQDIVRNAAIYFYIANELLSILENAGEIGLPVPDILKNAIERLKGKEQDIPG